MPDSKTPSPATWPGVITEPPGRPKPNLPDHELIRRIGVGAYGEVWLAKNVIGTYRAVKVVYRDSFTESRPYEREYRGMQKFEPISRSNDGFVDILQIGRNDEQGHFYYVMELADDLNAECKVQSADFDFETENRRKGETGKGSGGEPQKRGNGETALEKEDECWARYSAKTLRSEIQRGGRLPLEECLPIAMSLTLALGHLHRHGLIHRDIKPSNIIFVGGVPKLADIGLVTDVEEARSFVGTEGFIPPEGPNSPQADIYSLGKVLYEMSMGKDRLDFPEPFTGLGQSNTPGLDELNTVILKACATNPRDRYQTAEEMHVDLALVQSGKSVKTKHLIEKRLAFARKAGAIVGLIAAIATAGYLYQRHQTREAIRLQRVAEDLAARMQIQNAESMLERGESSLAVAHLAHVLRTYQSNRVAAERIMAALTQRNFPRLAIKPIVHEAKLSLPTHRSAARFSPDGRYILTVCDDHTVHLWNLATGKAVIPPHRHNETVRSAEFSPDGAKVVTASDDGTACVLDLRNGRLLFPPLQHGAGVNAATFSPDGKWLATASSNSLVRIFDALTGNPISAPLAHGSPVFAPDSQRLATGTADGQVRIFDINTHKETQAFTPGGVVGLVRFSGDGKWLAGAVFEDDKDGWHARVWNIETGASVILHPNERIYSIEFSPDSKRIVTASGNNHAQVWQVETGSELIRLPHRSIVYSASFSPDGRQILTGSVDHTARLWDASTGAALCEPMLHDARVMHAEFSPDGARVLTAGWEDKTVKIWEVRDQRTRSITLPHGWWVVSAEFGASGTQVLTATGGIVATAPTIDAWDFKQPQLVALWDLAVGGLERVPKVAQPAECVTTQFTRAGPKAFVSERTDHDRFSKHGWIWEMERGQPMGKELVHQQEITCACFSSDGSKLAVACIDGTVTIWDARRGVALTPPLAHGGRLRSVRFDSDANRLVSTSEQGTAMLWHCSTGQRVANPLTHDAAVWFAQFNHKGDKVVTTSLDYTARIWSTNGTLLATLHHRAPVEYAEFSPDGTHLATAAGDVARLWDAAIGRQITEPLQHAELVMTVRFSPDGHRVITASKDGTAQLWDAATGLKLSEPFRHDDWVVSARFSSDGRRVITASLDRTARIWEVPMMASPIPSWLAELAEVVVGQRLNRDRIPEPVSWAEYAELKTRLITSSSSALNSEWAKRLLEEPLAP